MTARHRTSPAPAPSADAASATAAAASDRPRAATLLAMRGFFRGPSELVDPALYVQPAPGSATLRRSWMQLEPGTVVSGNTYFGRFPASYWQRWTRVREVTVRLTATGSGSLMLGASDSRGGNRTVAATAVRDSPGTEIALTARLDRFLDGGALWLDVRTGPGEHIRVADVRWTVAAPARPRRAAAAICTMDRPDACLGNLVALAEDPVAAAVLAEVYVVDQGMRRVRDRPGFPDAERRLGGRLRYLTQPNLGGAGGFSRGLYEAAQAASDSGNPPPDVLFMDDDVLLEPDLLVRMTAFAASTAQPLILGGQMLNLLHPTRLHAGAEYTDLDRARPGALMPHSPHDAELLPDPGTGRALRQELRLDAGYNGWWACLIPAEVTAAIGYPLPLFFQGDDAEYSYRARAHGFPTLTLPGAGLWHTDFAWKDRDEINRYFIVRNYTIIAALNGRFPLRTLARTLAAELAEYLLGMQYGAAATVIAAVEDFLAGPEVLHDGGQEALERLRRLRAGHAETRWHPVTDVPGVPSNAIVTADPASGTRPRLRDLVPVLALVAPLLGAKAPGRVPGTGKARGVTGLPRDGARGPGGRVVAAVRHADAHWWHVASLGTAVVTDAAQHGVRLRCYDPVRHTRLTRDAVTVLWRLLREGPGARERYRAALPELSSRENWVRLFAGTGTEGPA